MSNQDFAIKVDKLSKHYRIGLKDKIHDSLGSAIISFLKSPLDNYRKYRSLYKFDDIKLTDNDNNSMGNPADIIWALKSLSFEVKKGEVLGIIGRNGAGKSTLLKVLSKITVPSSGRAEIHGRISCLLEVGTGFHFELTGRENVYLNGTILGMTKKEVDRKFDEIVEFSGVKKFIDTPVKRYSSGMKVRLGFSVAAYLEPEILIIDEVLAVGDFDFQKKCLNKMQEVGKQGRTVLFVSHNMQAITRLCSRAILLEEGQIKYDGPSSEVVAKYMTTDSGLTAERIWNDGAKAPGGEVARLCAVRVHDEDGNVSNSFDIRKSIGIQMEYEVLKSGYLLLPHHNVFNEEGGWIFTTFDTDQNWQGKHRPAGKYKGTVWIPGNFLSEGLLFIHTVLFTLKPRTIQFSERDVVAFQVIDKLDGNTARGDWSGPIMGAVRPLLNWTNGYEKLK